MIGKGLKKKKVKNTSHRTWQNEKTHEALEHILFSNSKCILRTYLCLEICMAFL